jgi:transposase-like protein
MHQILEQLLEASSQREAQRRLGHLREEIQEQASGALEVLEDGLVDATAVLALPGKYRRRLRTTNMLERFIEEIRRREKVIRIFPNIDSVERLVGALCAETHEEWSTGRRYLKMEEFLKWQAGQKTGEPDSEELPEPAAVVA